MTQSRGGAASKVYNKAKEAAGETVDKVKKQFKKWFSDERLKTGVSAVGSTIGGLPLYSYHYNAFAQRQFGVPPTEQIGVMAQDVKRVYPQAISYKGGYMQVDYSKLAQHRPAAAQLASSGADIRYSDARLKTNIRRVSTASTVGGSVMGASNSSMPPVIVNVTVAGSVLTERDLTDKITVALQKNLNRGYIPQGAR